MTLRFWMCSYRSPRSGGDESMGPIDAYAENGAISNVCQPMASHQLEARMTSVDLRQSGCQGVILEIAYLFEFASPAVAIPEDATTPVTGSLTNQL